MARSAPRRSLDLAIDAVMAPDLKQRGFKRSGLRWVHSEADRTVTLTIDSSSKNSKDVGLWRLFIHWQAGGQSGRTMLGLLKGKTVLAWDWSCQPGDPETVTRLVELVSADWQLVISPFLDACSDPHDVAWFMISKETGNVHFASSRVRDAFQLKDAALVEASLEGLWTCFERHHAEHGDEFSAGNRLLSFSRFVDDIEAQSLTDGARITLRRMLEGLERPDDGPSSEWYDKIARLAASS